MNIQVPTVSQATSQIVNSSKAFLRVVVVLLMAADLFAIALKFIPFLPPLWGQPQDQALLLIGLSMALYVLRPTQ